MTAPFEAPLVAAPPVPRAPRSPRAGLAAIACPLIPREIPAAIANLKAWATRFPPQAGGAPPAGARPLLVYSFSGAPDRALAEPLLAAFASHPTLRDSFAGAEVRFCGLPPEKDLYIRDPSGPIPPFGFKSGPNWTFYETMRALRPLGGFAFLMEVDCTPLVPGWLDRLAEAAARHPDAWVVGSHYRGVSPLHGTVARHINGNALYHVGDDAYWAFLDDHLWPWMHQHIARVDPNLAYDCAFEAMLSRAEMENPLHDDWLTCREVLHRFRLGSVIVNIGGHAEQSGHYLWTRAQLLARFPDAAVVHGPVAEDEAHRRGAMALGRPSLTPGLVAELDALRATLGAQDAVWDRSLWIADQKMPAGDVLSLRFGLEAGPGVSAFATLRDSMGRVLKRQMVRGGEVDSAQPRIRLSHKLASGVPFLRIELRIAGPEGSRAQLNGIAANLVRGEEVVASGLRLLR